MRIQRKIVETHSCVSASRQAFGRGNFIQQPCLLRRESLPKLGNLTPKAWESQFQSLGVRLPKGGSHHGIGGLLAEEAALALFLLLAVAVVSIAITISVAVSIAITMAMGVYAVEHQGHVFQLLVLVERLYVRQLAAIQLARSHHEYRKIGHAVGDAGVGYDAHGHAVGYDNVISLAQLAHQLVQPLVHQQLSGIWRHLARGYQVKRAHVADDVVHLHRRIRQVIGHAIVMAAEIVAQRALADIQVEHDHALVSIDKAHGQIAGHKRLAGALIERGKGDDLERMVFLGHKGHVGAQEPESLAHHAVIRPQLLGGSLLRGLLLLAPLAGVLFLVRNLAQEGHAQRLLHVFAAMHTGVHEQYHEATHGRQGHAHQQTQQEDAVALRGDGRRRAFGRVYHPGVVVGHGL